MKKSTGLVAVFACGVLWAPALASADTTPPPPTSSVVSAVTADGRPYTAGTWTNQNVTVTLECTTDGVVHTDPVTVDHDTLFQGYSVGFGCNDQEGRTTHIEYNGIKIDKTPPVVTGATAPAANGYGWNNTPVTVSFQCSDGLSGVGSVTQPVTLSGEGAGQTALGTCTDVAGNPATATSPLVNIDLTPPTEKLVSVTPAPNSAGWNNTPVTIVTSCTDALSGVLSPGYTVTDDGEWRGYTATINCSDKAYNGTELTSPVIKTDFTPPTITFSSSYVPGTWTNHDVAVSAACTDGLSGVAVAPADATLTGNGDVYTASCTDNAGNVARKTFGPVQIDRTPPVVVAHTGSYVPGTWTADDVTVSFTCTDDASGVASVTPETTVSTDTNDGSVTGTCTDTAGNSAPTTVQHIDVDKLAPTISGAPSATGWTNAPVTVTFTCADGGSGVASCTSPVTVSTEGENQSVTGTATDNVGHSSTATVDGIDIDLTAPLVSFSGNAGTYGILDTIAIGCTANDFLSGIATSSCPTLNAPAWQYVGGHTLDASATDRAGNVGSARATFTVVVRADDLATLVQQVVTNAGVASALGAMIEKSNVNAFDHLVEAQTGKAIDPATAALLLQLAAQL